MEEENGRVKNYLYLIYNIIRLGKSDKSYVPGALWDKVIDFTDEPVVQCDVPAAKNTSWDDDDNDDCKQILIGMLNILFLKKILIIFLVS